MSTRKVISTMTMRKKNSSARIIVSFVSVNDKVQLYFQVRGAKSIAERNELIGDAQRLHAEFAKEGMISSLSLENPNYEVQKQAEALM